MPQTIALGARYNPIDYPEIAREAQLARGREYQLENAPKRNTLESMQLDAGIAEAGAVKDYRDAAATEGPISSLSKLDAYPELQGKIWSAMDGMTLEDRQALQQKATLYGNAARLVKSFEPGSNEQKAAWNNAIQSLRQAGVLDEKTAQLAIKSGPNDLLINEALGTEQAVKAYKPSEQAALELRRAQTERIRSGTENDRMRTDAYVKKADQTKAEKAAKTDEMTTAQRNIWLEKIDKEKKRMEEDDFASPTEIAAYEDMMLRRYGLVKGAKPTDNYSVNDADTQSSPADGAVLTKPPPIDERVVGQAYSTRLGTVIWMGDGWLREDNGQ